MKTTLHLVVLTGALAFAAAGYADTTRDHECDAHGKITVITKDSITVDDQLFKVGDSTHVRKNGEEIKFKDLKVGDFVCVDTRGKDDLDGQIAGIKVLAPAEAKQYHEKDITIHEHERVKDKTESSDTNE